MNYLDTDIALEKVIRERSKTPMKKNNIHLTDDQIELAAFYLCRIFMDRYNEIVKEEHAEDKLIHYTRAIKWKEVENILHQKINYDEAFAILQRFKMIAAQKIIISGGLKEWIISN